MHYLRNLLNTLLPVKYFSNKSNSMPPPSEDDFLLLDGNNFKLLDGGNFLLLG